MIYFETLKSDALSLVAPPFKEEVSTLLDQVTVDEVYEDKELVLSAPSTENPPTFFVREHGVPFLRDLTRLLIDLLGVDIRKLVPPSDRY